MLFSHTIEDEKSWNNTKQQTVAFEPLIKHILKSEPVLLGDISKVEKATNAVFKVGNQIIKFFAPKEAGGSGENTERYYTSEVFGLERALSIGLSAPKILASGIIKDKYDFPYIVSELISGVELRSVYNKMSSNEKYELGRTLRISTNKMNTPCEPFNHIDYSKGLTDEGYNGWLIDIGYQKNFLDERNKHIRSLNLNPNDFVFCHGDMAFCNILYDSNSGLHIIDFACSVLSPVCIDHVYVAFWGGYDSSFIRGYFGEISINELVDICLNGFLLSINGIDLLATGQEYGAIDGKAFSSIEDFRIQLRKYIEERCRL
jgi:serine/threonine protein kinase